MQIGFIGLGKMGASMVERLLQHGHNVVAFDLNKASRDYITGKGAHAVSSLEEMIHALNGQKIIWSMVPAGKPTEDTIHQASKLVAKNDIIIDGGNSYYKDSMRIGQELREAGIDFVDVGTSGGIWGLQIGYCLMIGGGKKAVESTTPIFEALAPKDGFLHVGPSGTGHFVKMIHNGIEYALMQAYAEGFEIMQAKKDFNLDLAKIAHVWNQGSVIRSWLLELAQNAFEHNADLDSIQGYVQDSGEGRWTVMEAIEQGVPAPTVMASLFERFRSRQNDSFSAKVVAALRNEFGGHAIKKK